jgi:hypothetical protein
MDIDPAQATNSETHLLEFFTNRGEERRRRANQFNQHYANQFQFVVGQWMYDLEQAEM